MTSNEYVSCLSLRGDSGMATSKESSPIPSVPSSSVTPYGLSGLPALLTSYVYYKQFRKEQHLYGYRDWILDSGAFSAWKSGKVIDLQEYIDFCHLVKERDPRLVEIVALDVIGDAEGSVKNTEKMRDSGLEVMPVFHCGDPWDFLQEYCKHYKKVGLSCRFGEPTKESYKFLDGSFGRAYPHKFHSFGWVDEKCLLRYPFHSADSASWDFGPRQYGKWKAFAGHLSVHGSAYELFPEIRFYLELEAKVRKRWEKEIKGKLGANEKFVLRLAYSIAPNSKRALKILGEEKQETDTTSKG